MGERGRIALLPHDHETGPGAVGSFKLGFGLSLGENPDRGAASPAGQGWQGLERRLGAAKLMTSTRKVAGPTFSLRISLSQASR